MRPEQQNQTGSQIRIVSNTFGADHTNAVGAGVGETLRAARESRRLTLDQAGMALKIKPVFLAALESERYDALPTVTHARGFLRSYAQFLGLNDRIDTMLALFQRSISNTKATPSLAMPQPLPEGKLPTARVIFGALAVAVALYFLWSNFQASPPPVSIAPPPMVQPAPTPAPAPTVVTPPVAETPATPEPVPAISPPPPPQETKPAADNAVRVRAIADSWVEVQDHTGATVYSHLLKTGQEYTVPPEPGLHLMTGNGAGIVIVRDGKPGAPLGKTAEVVRNVSLSAMPEPAKPVTKPAAPKKAAAPKPTITWNPSPADEDAAVTDETD